jgi:CRP-like cAMP-binding protein
MDGTNGHVTGLRELFTDRQVGGTIEKVNAGTVLFEQGAPADDMYYIEQGQVRVYQAGIHGDCRLVEILGPGQYFGIGALAGSGTRATRAVAVTAAELIRTPVARLLASLKDRPEVAVALVRHLAGDVQSARADAARLIFEDSNARLVEALVRFSHSAAASRDGSGVVLRITHEQLAQAIGVARETVSLALTEMRQLKLVRTGRNQLMYDPEALARSTFAHP